MGEYKIITLTGLQDFLTAAKNLFAFKSHTHVKSEVGLENVDNTKDSTKSVKYADSAGNADTVNNHSVNSDVPLNAVFTDSWRGIQNNLTSDSTTESLSAAQGKELKKQIDEKVSTEQVSIEIENYIKNNPVTESFSWEYIGEFTNTNQPTFESEKYRFFYITSYWTTDALPQNTYAYLCLDGWMYHRYSFTNMTKMGLFGFLAHGKFCITANDSTLSGYPNTPARSSAPLMHIVHEKQQFNASKGTAYWMTSDMVKYPLKTFGIKLWGAK